MSALTLKGPYWVAVRQHRTVLWAVFALVGLGLVAVIALRVLSGDRDADRMTSPSSYYGWEALRLLIEYAGNTLLFLPLLAGAFVAGPMVARELESGTWRLALTQSTTAKAWLGSKVLVAAVVAVLGSVALIGVYRLGWSNVSGSSGLHWADRGPYEAAGPVLVGYCLLGVALGALVGQLVRRTLPAMAVTGLLTGLVLLVLGVLRWSLLPVVTTTAPYPGPGPRWSGYALMMDTGYLSSTGERLSEDACFNPTDPAAGCPADLNITARYADFHPASHHWPTQLIETSILLALAAAVLYAAFRLVRARHP
ncbi:ABC transporter permease [Streptomyces sp. NBC_01264]|uniref:ABC transporter permease n=1 Tax=Streptomyces sp. NBC_01264 TaxID=2903804 RepID=UPI0022567342|nr:ABC transporter permease [Streptomyces sp. NBC_01264]MCX4782021.1 ABC transporter permease [Streptomyces sp. NBC_01264]